MRYGFHVIWISGGLLLISFLLMFLERLDNGGKRMETIFPREEKADLLFDKILKDPEACERLMQTFYGEIDSDLELVGGYLPPEQFAKALFDAYKTGI